MGVVENMTKEQRERFAFELEHEVEVFQSVCESMVEEGETSTGLKAVADRCERMVKAAAERITS